MRKRNVIAIILTAVVFIAAAVLGVSSVYRVNTVTLDVSVISEDARSEAEELQKRLLERYKDENIFALRKSEAEEAFSDFPYFRMISFKKAYPNRLIISAAEDAEVFAVEKGDGSYYILNADGMVLGERNDVSNRSDGGANVLVTGLAASGERGGLLRGDESIPYFLQICTAISLQLDGLRSNLVSVEVMKPTSSARDVSFLLRMREGTVGYISNPYELTEKKAAAFLSLYFSLRDEQKLGGRISVTDDGHNPGEVLASYSKNI